MRMVIATLAAALLSGLSQHAALADEQAVTYARVRSSLALVVAPAGPRMYSFGTAFCVASTDAESYFLTSRHVVGSVKEPGLILVAGPGKIYKGEVVRLSQYPLDAAVIAVNVGNIRPLNLAADIAREGQAVGIAGFPTFQVELLLQRAGLLPSVHFGAVSSLIADGSLIEYDALTDHGNSGGPLFDPTTGLVYGIVTFAVPSRASQAVQNNIAISINRTFEFLNNAGVKYTTLRRTAFTPGPQADASTAPKETSVKTTVVAGSRPATR